MLFSCASSPGGARTNLFPQIRRRQRVRQWSVSCFAFLYPQTIAWCASLQCWRLEGGSFFSFGCSAAAAGNVCAPVFRSVRNKKTGRVWMVAAAGAVDFLHLLARERADKFVPHVRRRRRVRQWSASCLAILHPQPMALCANMQCLALGVCFIFLSVRVCRSPCRQGMRASFFPSVIEKYTVLTSGRWPRRGR